MEEKIKKQIIEWLLDGVMPSEIQTRLSWLKIIVTIKEIENISKNVVTEEDNNKKQTFK